MTTNAPTVEDVRTVVSLAALAPSVHNSQPWAFRWDGAALEVREDRTRALPVLDPTGRERVLSCGAALLHAELALTDLGWQVRTTLLPDPGDDALLARVEVVGRRDATAREHALASAVLRRTTDRDPYDDRPLAPAVLELLRTEAELEGGWLRVLAGDDEVRLDVLLSRADDAQRSDPAYLAELDAWRTAAGAFGVGTRTLPSVPADGRGSSLALRDFDAARRQQAVAHTDPPPAEHPAVVVVGTGDDTRRDWLVAGRATARLLLAATVEDLAAQPLSAVLEVPTSRARLRADLGVLGHPQMVLRLGHGTRGPASRRLPVDQVLELVAP